MAWVRAQQALGRMVPELRAGACDSGDAAGAAGGTRRRGRPVDESADKPPMRPIQIEGERARVPDGVPERRYAVRLRSGAVRDLTLCEVTEVLRESGVTWLGPTTPAYALCPAVDMRRGFDGLYGLPTQTLGRDVLRGDLFLFVGRDCLRAKPLYFDGTGLCLLQAAEQGAVRGAVP